MVEAYIMCPKLIIFDCDGVLVDSEVIWHRVNVERLTKACAPITLDQSISRYGSHLGSKVDGLLGQQQVIEIGQQAERRHESDLKAIDGIKTVLDTLSDKGIAYGVASNADAEYIQRALMITGLAQYFPREHIFSAKDLGKLKPAPDVFLYVSKQIGVLPKHCLVVEDHALGIQAARTAGMAVVGFSGASHANNPAYRAWLQQAKPDMLINDMHALLQYWS